MAELKLKEGHNRVREAQKCLKTGLLKWKPDYEGAAYEYSKAALAFKNAKAYSEAVDCYMKQAGIERNHGSSYQAARAIEAAGMIHKEQGHMGDAFDLLSQAGTLQLESGTGHSAVIMLNRAAKIMEPHLPEKAIILYKKAADAAEAEDGYKESAENIGRAGRVYLKIGKLEEAAQCVDRELGCLTKTNHSGVLNKLMMGLILIHLHRDDYSAADAAMQKALRNYSGFLDSEEAGPIERFLDLWREGDEEGGQKICRGPLFAYIENDFTKLARDLKYPPKKEKPAKAAKATPSEGGDEGGDDDEYSEGLL